MPLWLQRSEPTVTSNFILPNTSSPVVSSMCKSSSYLCSYWCEVSLILKTPLLVPLPRQLFPDSSCILVSISSLATLLVWHLSLWNAAFACRCACPRGLRGPWGERPFLIICATLSLGTVLWDSRTDSNNSIYSQSHTLLRLMLLSEHSIAPKCLNILSQNCKVKTVQRIKAGDTRHFVALT